ncbi:hypothetical protein BGZ94_008557, partial [Podila epigama]
MTALGVSQDQRALKFWRTPKGQTLLQVYTILILRLIVSFKVTNIRQSRVLMNHSSSVHHFYTGTYTQKSKDKWATKVDGEGWTGFWIPFQDQVNMTKSVVHPKLTVADIGAGCDIVIFAIHGGGMVLGDALMFLPNYRSWMKQMQQTHNLKIGILSIEY